MNLEKHPFNQTQLIYFQLRGLLLQKYKTTDCLSLAVLCYKESSKVLRALIFCEFAPQIISAK